MLRSIRTGTLVALVLGAAATPAAAQEPPTCGVTVFFNSGQTQIGRQARDVLVRYARDYPGAPMVVTGYSDASGSAAANQALSLRRARSVAAALEGTDILSVTGAGAAVRPGTSGPDDPANRRVEAVRRDCGTVPGALDANAGLAAGAGAAALAIGAAIGGDDDDGDDDAAGSTGGT